MAKIPKKLLLSNSKTRNLVFIGVAVVIIIFVFVYLRSNQEPSVGGQSHVTAIPYSIQNVPGNKLTPEYYRALVQANQQKAKEAEMSGQSSVSTLVNTGNLHAGENCSHVCCSCENANVGNTLQALLKSGKISKATSDYLTKLADKNVPVSAYADALDKLVREGKLTPEEARKLLAEYKKQHANAQAKQGAKLMDQLIKSGKLPVDAANALLGLQKNGASVGDYGSELARLVREGKISPETAKRLLAAYKKQKAAQMAAQADQSLQDLVASGKLSQQAAKDLTDMQKKNVPVSQYADYLNHLVKEGKLSPADAKRLLSQYQALHDAKVKPGSLLKQLEAEGLVSPDVASQLQAMQDKDVPVSQYADYLKRLVAEGKISPATARRLLDAYALQHPGSSYAQKAKARKAALNDLQAMVASGEVPPDVAKKLASMINADVPVSDYKRYLDQLVREGKISPEVAKKLLADYRRTHAHLSGVGNLVDTGLPGSFKGGSFGAASDKGLAAPQTSAGHVPGGFGDKTPANVSYKTSAAALPIIDGQTDATLSANPKIRALQMKAVEDLASSMTTQAQNIIKGSTPPALQQATVALPPPSKSIFAGGNGAASSSSEGASSSAAAAAATPPLVKAGDLEYAVLDTSVNSDYPNSPVMATIVQGRLKGAKLLGTLSTGAHNGDRVVLSFNLLNMPAWSVPVSIKAVAIDPHTSKSAIATSVNHHILSRYGALFASAFIEGLGESYTQAGSIEVNSGMVTVQRPKANTAGHIYAGLGKVGEASSNASQQYFNTPPTVKVKAGVGLGILFMENVSAPVPGQKAPQEETPATKSASAQSAIDAAKAAVKK